MAGMKEAVQWQTLSGEPVTVGEIKVTPQSQALLVRWSRGGWIWQRPTAVLVQRGEDVERVPIVDVTRVAQLVLWGLSILFAVLAFVLSLRRSKRKEEA